VKFPRETATHIEDLPHRYERQADARGCDVCGWEPEDARHAAWEKSQVNMTENAKDSSNGAVTRQFG
jgi:hypothetical protein